MIDVSEWVNFLRKKFSVSPDCQPQSVFSTQEALTADQLRVTEHTYLIQIPNKQSNRSQKLPLHYHAWPPLLNTFSVHLMDHLQQPTRNSDSMVHEYFVATLLWFFCTKTRISFPTVKMGIPNYFTVYLMA